MQTHNYFYCECKYFILRFFNMKYKKKNTQDATTYTTIFI